MYGKSFEDEKCSVVSLITSSVFYGAHVASELTFKMSLWGVAGNLPKPINNIKCLFTAFTQPTPALPTNKRTAEDQRDPKDSKPHTLQPTPNPTSHLDAIQLTQCPVAPTGSAQDVELPETSAPAQLWPPKLATAAASVLLRSEECPATGD